MATETRRLPMPFRVDVFSAPAGAWYTFARFVFELDAIGFARELSSHRRVAKGRSTIAIYSGKYIPPRDAAGDRALARAQGRPDTKTSVMSTDPATVRVDRTGAIAAALGARPLPPGYALTCSRGRAWTSYGYLQEDYRGRLVSAALGYKTPREASEAAWEHDNEQLRELQRASADVRGDRVNGNGGHR